MKKDLVKGILIGVGISLTISFYLPVLADVVNADVIFNAFRLKNDEGTIFSRGENLTLEDGKTVPSSITYDSEAYLSMSSLESLFGRNLIWNGDSSTYTLLQERMPYSNTVWKRETTDALGHTWIYEIRTDYSVYYGENSLDDITGRTYLYVSDEERGYSHAYMLAGREAYAFTGDEVYFVVNSKQKSDAVPGGISWGIALTKLIFANDPDNQDGDEIYTHYASYRQGFSAPTIIDGVLYYFQTHGIPSGSRTHYTLVAVNCENPENESLLFSYWTDGDSSVTIDSVKDGYIFFQIRTFTTGLPSTSFIYKYCVAEIDADAEIVELSGDEYSDRLKGAERVPVKSIAGTDSAIIILDVDNDGIREKTEYIAELNILKITKNDQPFVEVNLENYGVDFNGTGMHSALYFYEYVQNSEGNIFLHIHTSALIGDHEGKRYTSVSEKYYTISYNTLSVVDSINYTQIWDYSESESVDNILINGEAADSTESIRSKYIAVDNTYFEIPY